MVNSQVSAGCESSAQWASVHHAHNSQRRTHRHWRKGKRVRSVNFLNRWFQTSRCPSILSERLIDTEFLLVKSNDVKRWKGNSWVNLSVEFPSPLESVLMFDPNKSILMT